MKHVSIDLETLGKGPNAAIVQIGWCPFDLHTGEVGEAHVIGVSPTCGDIDPSTVGWWFQQSEAALQGMVTAIDTGVSLSQALQMLTDQLGATHDLCVWGNGATFDITILESAYGRVGRRAPWEFYNVRDMRTIVHAAQELRGFSKRSIVHTGLHHDAGDDAQHQARVITAAWECLK